MSDPHFDPYFDPFLTPGVPQIGSNFEILPEINTTIENLIRNNYCVRVFSFLSRFIEKLACLTPILTPILTPGLQFLNLTRNQYYY